MNTPPPKQTMATHAPKPAPLDTPRMPEFTRGLRNTLWNAAPETDSDAPTNAAASSAAGSVGYTDLLITWLFKITTGAEAQYYMASVIGILVFVVVAVISLVVYNLLPSIKNEEDFQ